MSIRNRFTPYRPMPILFACLFFAGILALPGCQIEMNGKNVSVKEALSAKEAQETVQQRVAGDRVNTLDVNTTAGNIAITPSAKADNSLLIRATRHITGDRSASELKSYFGKIPLPTYQLKQNTLEVRSSVPSGVLPDGIGYYVSYAITVPKRLALTLNAVSGDIKVDEIEGGVTAETSSGAIDLHTVAGTLNLHTSSGNIDVTDAPDADFVAVETSSGNVDLNNIAGRCTARSVSGDISLNGAGIQESLKLDSSSGELKCQDIRAAGNQLALSLTSVSGDISYKGDASRIEAHTSSGGIEIESTLHLPLAAVTAESVSGNLNLTLPGLSSAQINAHSVSGSLKLPQGRGNSDAEGEGEEQHNMTVTLGTGTTLITLNSSSGDIALNSER